MVALGVVGGRRFARALDDALGVAEALAAGSALGVDAIGGADAAGGAIDDASGLVALAGADANRPRA